MRTMLSNRSLPNTGGWQDRHDAAVMSHLPTSYPNHLTAPSRAFETAIVRGLDAWRTYAEVHRYSYDSPIGNDHILGPAWSAWGLGLRALLNGQAGRLDCGTLDGWILETMRQNGIEEE